MPNRTKILKNIQNNLDKVIEFLYEYRGFLVETTEDNEILHFEPEIAERAALDLALVELILELGKDD